MPPAPAPTPETAPVLDAKVVSEITPGLDLNLGPNTKIFNSSNGFQTALPLTTSDAVYSSSFNVLPGSAFTNILKSDNLTITSAGNLTKVGAITSTGHSTFSGSVTAGSLSTTGSLSAKSVSAADGGFTTTSGNFTTTTGKVSTKELQVAGTKLSVDSLTGALTSTGVVSIANADNTFQINSSSGAIKTQGTIQAGGTIQAAGAISTTGTANITAAGAVNGASLNIAGNAFKVDSFGAVTGPGSKYSIDKDGNLSHDGILTTKSSASLANGSFLVDVNGNVTKVGTIASKAVSVNGSLTTTEGITVGSGAILLSNNSTSTFKNSMNLGAAPASSSTYPIMFNAADGSASFASGKSIIGADGSMSLLNGATLLNADGLKLGVNAGNTSNKIELSSSSGNATFAGQASFLGGAATLTNAGLTMLGGDVSVKNIIGTGSLSVGGAATLQAGLTVTGGSTLHGAATLSNTLAVTGATTLSSTLALNGAATLSNTLDVTGATRLSSTLAVTGAATLSNTLAVTGDLSVSTNKFKVTATNGDTMIAGNLRVTGDAAFSNSQIQLKSDGSLYAQNYLKTDFAVANYSPNNASSDVTTVTLPVAGSAAYTSLFGSSTNKYLTTQEYVDKEIFKQTARLNFITKDVNAQLATFENIGKVLAAMEGPDGINPLTTVNGLVDEVHDVKVSISDLMGGGYNSVVINCVPSVWGDAAQPQLIPTPISNIYKEDGWFYSNMKDDSKINWYLPSYKGMQIKNITNLFMNNFLLSSVKLPKITIYTSPKSITTDILPGVYNAKIEYIFEANSPTSPVAERSCMYLINPPKNVYSDKSNDMKCKYSFTTGIKNSIADTTKTTFNLTTGFSTSFDTSKVSGDDYVLTFAIETDASLTQKDYMFILQNFNVSSANGTTQMLFQNASIASDYLFKYFFEKHLDFSSSATDYIDNLVDKNNSGEFYKAISNGTTSPIYTLPSNSTIISPQSHFTDIKLLTLGGKPVTQREGDVLIFESNTTNVNLICKLVNSSSNTLTITQKSNNVTTIIYNAVGDCTKEVTLVEGENVFVVTVKDEADSVHTKVTTFKAKVLSSDSRLDKITIEGQEITVGGTYITSTTVNSVAVAVTAKSSLATTAYLGNTGIQPGVRKAITVTITGENTINKSEYTVYVYVKSADTSYNTLTVNGAPFVSLSTVSLPTTTTFVPVAVVTTSQPSSYGAGASYDIVGNTMLVEGNNELKVTITAENGITKQEYKCYLYRKNDTRGLSSITINGQTVSNTASTFTFASVTKSVNVVATPNSTKSNVVVSGTSNLQPGSNTMTITVTTENGSVDTYTKLLNILTTADLPEAVFIDGALVGFDADNKKSITLINKTSLSIRAISNETAETLAQGVATLTYSLNGASSVPLTSNVSSIVNSLLYGKNSLIVIDKADEGNVFATYTFDIDNVSNNADLSELIAVYTDAAQSQQSVNLLTSSTNPYVLPSSLGDSIEVTIKAKPAEHAIVKFDNSSSIATRVNGYFTKTITITAGNSRNVEVVVTADDKTTVVTKQLAISMPSNAPVLNNDTSLSILGTSGYGQSDNSSSITYIINTTTGFQTGTYSKPIDLDTNFVLLNANPTNLGPTLSPQKGVIITATSTNRNATITLVPPDLTKNELINFVDVNVTSSDGSATQTYKITLPRQGIISSDITLGTNTSYKSEVTIADGIKSIVLNPSPGQATASNEIALKTSALNANVSVNLIGGQTIYEIDGTSRVTKNLNTYATKNEIKLEFTFADNPTKYYQTLTLTRSSGYASLDRLLIDNDLTLSSGSSIMTSDTNGTTQLFGFAFSNASYTLKNGPGSSSSSSFKGPKINIVASYDAGLNWRLLNYSYSSNVPNADNFSFVTSGDGINTRSFPSDFSIVYNNNENTVLSLNNASYYLIFNRNDLSFSRSLVNISGSTSTSVINSTTSALSYCSVLYLSRVTVSNVSYDYYAIVVNNGVSYYIFIMARELGSTSNLKTLSIVVQCSSAYIFGAQPVISKVTNKGIDYFNVLTGGNSTVPSSVPSGTYRISISSLTETMNAKKYLLDYYNVIALTALSSDATLSSFNLTDSTSHVENLNNSSTSQQVTLTQGATYFSINATASNSNAIIFAQVDGVDTTWTSSGTGNISINPGSTVSVAIVVTAESGMSSSLHTVNVTNPANASAPAITSLAFMGNTYTPDANDNFNFVVNTSSTPTLTSLTVNTSSNVTLELNITTGGLYFNNSAKIITISSQSLVSSVNFDNSWPFGTTTVLMKLTDSNGNTKTYKLVFTINVNYMPY